MYGLINFKKLMWYSNSFNIKKRTSDGVIVINYCILYAKYYIYLDKLNDNNKKHGFNVDFLGYAILKESWK